MASKEVKQRVRSSVLSRKLSVKTESKRDELFIDHVYKELNLLMETIMEKHDGCFPENRKKCHEIVDIGPMAFRILVKIHDAIYRRLRSTPTTSSAYLCCFKQEVQQEVFNVIWKQIIEQNSFGHTSTSTDACIQIVFEDKRKVVYMMNKVNDNGFYLEKSEIFKRKFEDGGVAEVLLSKDKPLTFKYSFKKEVLTVSFSYDYWNSFGVPQH